MGSLSPGSGLNKKRTLQEPATMEVFKHPSTRGYRVQLKTILNSIEKHRSFVYSSTRLVKEGSAPCLEVEIRPRANGQAVCSGCGEPSPGYDRLPIRRFEYVPLWGMAVYFLYAMRRVNCARCGVVVERVPCRFLGRRESRR